MEQEYLTPTEAAKVLRMSKSRVLELIRKDLIGHCPIGRGTKCGRYLISRADIDEFYNRGRCKPIGQPVKRDYPRIVG